MYSRGVAAKMNDRMGEMKTIIETLTLELSEKNNIIARQNETIANNKILLDSCELPDRIFWRHKITKKKFLFKLQCGKCCYCSKSMGINKMTMEHLIPKSHGGTRLTGNLALCCQHCNNKRGNNIHDSKSLRIIQERTSSAWWLKFRTSDITN